ncbi:MAG: hypothetical protein [CRESS associated satellite molecule]|uniref:Uncharacterized protein n=1 Tax=CRESS associated satellite molecule TaxID=2656732 RepID=A0A5Q2W1V2_9VIRU|nr:MAG: hypothetical protein [CRESS associated satellite molecule]
MGTCSLFGLLSLASYSTRNQDKLGELAKFFIWEPAVPKPSPLLGMKGSCCFFGTPIEYT